MAINELIKLGFIGGRNNLRILVRYRPPLKTNTLAGLQLLGRFLGKYFARRFTTLLVRWWEKLCRADHFIFGSLVGKEIVR